MTIKPDAYEQLTLELINQVRMDPDGEFARLILNAGTRTAITPEITDAIRYFNVNLAVLQQQFAALAPVAPLAWSDQLSSSATTHSQLMINFNQQSHNLPGEAGLLQRVQQTGYQLSRVGENIFAFGQDALYTHAGFFIDWGDTPTGIQEPAGHRNTIMADWAQEIGVAALPENNAATQVGPMVVTHHIAARPGYAPQLLGVIINDLDHDDFYDIGEGVGGVTVTVAGSGGTFTTTSWDAGGYQLVVPAGQYTVTYQGNGVQHTFSLAMGNQNVKHDVESAASLNQTFVSGPGNETFDGQAGFDTVIYGGSRAAFAVAGTRAAFTITGPNEGTDSLLGIERVRFDDRSYNLDVLDAAQQIGTATVRSIIDLYIGYFNRVPEAEGLVYWIRQIQAGASLDQIAARFYDAGIQFSDQTGYSSAMSVRDFVLIAYDNVLGRTGVTTPSEPEIGYWVGRITGHQTTREGMIKQMLSDARNFANDPTWSWVPQTLENKVDFGYSHAVTFGVDYNDVATGITATMAMADSIDQNGSSAAVQLMGLGPDDHI